MIYVLPIPPTKRQIRQNILFKKSLDLKDFYEILYHNKIIGEFYISYSESGVCLILEGAKIKRWKLKKPRDHFEDEYESNSYIYKAKKVITRYLLDKDTSGFSNKQFNWQADNMIETVREDLRPIKESK